MPTKIKLGIIQVSENLFQTHFHLSSCNSGDLGQINGIFDSAIVLTTVERCGNLLACSGLGVATFFHSFLI